MLRDVDPHRIPLLFESDEAQQLRGPDWYDQIYIEYQNSLTDANTSTSPGRLVVASESLLKASKLLLGNAASLGVTKDDGELYSERLKLWRDFNHSWLALLQRQLENTQNAAQAPPDSPNMLPGEALLNLGDSITEFCDGLEEYGLVDYEMGVWEEEIVGVLVRCIDAREELFKYTQLPLTRHVTGGKMRPLTRDQPGMSPKGVKRWF